MKMGRFDESIAQYRKALEVNPQFSPSYIGIASNLTFQGKYDASRAEAKKLYDRARNDGDKRAAMFATTITYIDEGKTDLALAELEKQYTLGKGTNDAGAMAGDATFMGNVLLATGKPAEAMKRFEQALQVVDASQLSPEVKENTKQFHHYNAARVAIATGDLAKARSENRSSCSRPRRRRTRSRSGWVTRWPARSRSPRRTGTVRSRHLDRGESAGSLQPLPPGTRRTRVRVIRRRPRRNSRARSASISCRRSTPRWSA